MANKTETHTGQLNNPICHFCPGLEYNTTTISLLAKHGAKVGYRFDTSMTLKIFNA